MEVVMRIFVLFLTLLAVPVLAQEKPAVPSLFQDVIPRPTGENGYEELVRAAETLQNSERFRRLDWTRLTLAQKRALLEDPTARRALLLLEAGLKKPVVSVRETFSFSTRLPELSQFRNLGRVLAMKQYVQLADGRTRDAIQTTRIGLRFARVVQMDTVIGGLVGAAITRLTLRPMAEHLDQMSAGDCEQLYKLCLQALSTPEPMAALIAAERRGIRSSLVELEQNIAKEGPDAAQFSATRHLLFGPLPNPPMNDAEREQNQLAQDLCALARDPPGLKRILEETGRKIDEYLDKQVRQAAVPAFRRDRTKFDADGSLSGRLAGAVATDFALILDRFTEERVLIQQLAVHAAIHRYRWENDRLPDSLVPLNLGVLELDPFTGAALVYKVDGPRYRLSSPGYPVAADDALAVDGRRPVALIQ
jgi:hypothetical protein